MRIRWRLAFYGAAVTSAALFVFALLLNLIVVPGAQEDQDLLLSSIADAAVASIEAADQADLVTGSPPVVIDPATSDQPFVVVVDETGAALYSNAAIEETAPHLPAALIVEALETGSSSATFEESRYQARSFDHPEAGPGVAAAGQSTRVAAQQVAGARAFLVIFAIITVVAAAVVSWLVSGRALRPLNTLARTADHISTTGDLTQRLPSVRTKDEVGALTSSFNGMLDRLADAQAQLERTVDAQRRFVADASHELRTPLTTIRSNAGFLREHPQADPSDRDASLVDIETEAERMSRLVNDLLVLARSDAGAEVESRPVVLAEVVEGAIGKARHLGDRLSLQVEDDAVVSADSDALTQVVLILVDNAERHGRGAIMVTIGADGPEALLVVEDQGSGIPEAEVEKVFERFHRADGTRHHGGFGLGLAIARSIVEAHDGTISARNGDAGGARFEVRLPLL